MAAVDDLYIRILADGSQLGAGLSQAEGKLNIFGQGVEHLGGMLAKAFTVVAIERFIEKSIEAADEAARAVAKVAQAIKTTSGVAGQSLEGLKEEAEKIQGFTLFDKDKVLNDVTAQMLTFSNVAGDTFKRAQMAALDLNTVLANGEGLTGTTIQLGKALNDPVKGITALQRSGVSFTPVQRELIKNFAETNQLAKAQDLILGEIERQYGGQAKAAADASNGITQMKNAMGEFMKMIGGTISESSMWKSVITDITETLTVLSSPDYSMWEKYKTFVWGADEAMIAEHKATKEEIAAQRELEELFKKREDEMNGIEAPKPQKKETTYNDLKADLKEYETQLEDSTVATRAHINQEIEATKLKIKAWEEAGKAVIDYKGTIKGLEQELSVLNAAQSTTTGARNIAVLTEQIKKKEEEIKILKNASVAWVEYGATLSKTIDLMASKYTKIAIPAGVLQSNKSFMDKQFANFQKGFVDVVSLNKSMNDAIASGLSDMISNMTMAAVSGGNIGQALLGSFGSLLTQLGEMVLKAGMAILAVKLSLKPPFNPYLAIAAGVALIAIGSAFSNSSSSLGDSMGSGGGGSYGSTGSSGSGGGTYDTRQSTGQQEIKLRLEGRDLVGAIQVNQLYYTRKG